MVLLNLLYSDEKTQMSESAKNDNKCGNCGKLDLELRKAKAIIIKSKEAKEFLSAKKKAAALSTENKRLALSLETLKKEMEGMIAKYAESGKLKGTVDLLQERIGEMKVMIETRDEEVAEAKKQLNVISVDRDRHIEMLKFAQDDKTNLLAEKKNQMAKLEKDNAATVASLESTVKSQSEELERVSTDLSELKSTYNVSLQQNEQLMKDLDISRSTINNMEQQLQEKQASIDGLSAKLGKTVEENVTAMAKHEADAKTIEELQQRITDVGLESKVAEKKNVQLIKELKSQLAKVNSSPHPSSRSQQQQPARKPPPNATKPAKPPSTTSSAAPHAGTAAATNNYAAAAAAPSDDAIGAEMEMLLHRMTKIQEEKWQLEVELRDAQVSVAELQAAVSRGREVMRHWAMERKVGGRRDQKRDAVKSPARHGGVVPEALRIETIQKLEQVLEDALMENIQLKTDINVVATELEMFKTGKK